MRNVKVEPLEIPEEKIDYLKRILSSNTSEYHKNIAKRRISGSCSMCHNIPSHIVTYSRLGVTILEKYCDICLERRNKLI